MAYSELAKNAYHHLTKLGPKKLSEFIESVGPIDIPVQYGDDLLLGLSRIVVGQQLSNQAARSIWDRLVTQYPQRSKINRCAQKSRNAKYRIVGLEKTNTE